MSALKERMTTELQSINAMYHKSAWNRGVAEYTAEIMNTLAEYDTDPASVVELKAQALNGATDWNAYSWGGCSLCYDSDIAERLCNPSELKRTRNGERRPNSREEWLDTQARALKQAYSRVASAYRRATA